MNMQCIMLHWDSLRPVIRQQTACGQWKRQQDVTKWMSHYHLCNNTEHLCCKLTTICQGPLTHFVFLLQGATYLHLACASIFPWQAHRWGVERISERRLRRKTDSHRAHWASQGTVGPAPAAIQNGGIGQGNLVQALWLVERTKAGNEKEESKTKKDSTAGSEGWRQQIERSWIIGSKGEADR